MLERTVNNLRKTSRSEQNIQMLGREKVAMMSLTGNILYTNVMEIHYRVANTKFMYSYTIITHHLSLLLPV